MKSGIKNLRVTAVLLPLLVLSGCAVNTDWMRQVEQPLKFNQPQQALMALESTGSAEDAALYLVSKGTLLRMTGDIEGSIQAFEAAKPLITFQEASSLTGIATSLTLTEGSGGYQPPAFEQVQLHFYQALNRMDVGDWEAARIEAMQIDILLERRWDGGTPFGADAAARFLTGIIFEGVGETDNALIAYRKAYEAYKDRSSVGGVPAELERRLLVLTRKMGLRGDFDAFAAEFGEQRKNEALARIEAAKTTGEVILVASTGLVPARYEERAQHMDPASGAMVTIALPALAAPSSMIAGVGLQRGNQNLGYSDTLADLSILSQRTLDDELPGLIAKSVARNVVKNVAANEAAEQFGLLGGLLVNVAGSAMESADVRCWHTLPQHIQVVSARLEPGSYTDLAVEYRGAGGNIREPLTREVRVALGAPTVVSVHRVAP